MKKEIKIKILLSCTELNSFQSIIISCLHSVKTIEYDPFPFYLNILNLNEKRGRNFYYNDCLFVLVIMFVI